jgi:hypothetical protein
MATSVYQYESITLIDGTEIEISPLKIKYLKEFLDKFEDVKGAANDENAIVGLSECARIAMKQFYPSIKTIEDLEDNLDLPTIYKILDIAAGIKIKEDSQKEVKEQAVESGATWDDLDLASLESEVFLLGIWKDYNELETSLSMVELSVTLESKRKQDYQDKKFFAAIQGVDLDKESGNKNEPNAWEKMKARVFSGGASSDPNDVLSLQGANAAKAGFGIGMGLSYEKIS